MEDRIVTVLALCLIYLEIKALLLPRILIYIEGQACAFRSRNLLECLVLLPSEVSASWKGKLRIG